MSSLIEAVRVSPGITVKDGKTFRISGDKGTEAGRVIRNKILWLVPNWNCNRNRKVCGVCFAADIMKDAADNGYQSAGNDFYEKAQVLTQLPWKEVIITGGEPTIDPQILGNTLGVIDPQRVVRIISNGDWILREDLRERVLDTIRSSGRDVQIDISAHDTFAGFRKKIDALVGLVRFGVQLREEEQDNTSFTRKKDYLDDLVREGVLAASAVEIHHTIEIGNAVRTKELSTDSVRLNLQKLIGYSGRDENVGMYLLSGKGGARVIVNHETPYITTPTPADIACPQDTADEVLEKVLDYYANPQGKGNVHSETVLAFAASAFRSGVPLDLNGYSSVKDPMFKATSEYSLTARKTALITLSGLLMDSYYQIISEKSGIETDQIKKLVIQRLGNRFNALISSGHIPSLSALPVTWYIAREVPRSPDELADVILDGLINGTIRILVPVGIEESKRSGNILNLFWAGERSKHSQRDLSMEDQLMILGISPEELTTFPNSGKGT